jgi:hypothetical protein
MQQTQASLGGIAGYCTQTWKPSKEQTVRYYPLVPITLLTHLRFRNC